VAEVKELTTRDPAKRWILHNALPEPDQLEFKVNTLEAANMDVEMIGALTHGRGAMHPLVVRSVRQEIVRKPRCPVLFTATHQRT
jgi:hypothetical protein